MTDMTMNTGSSFNIAQAGLASKGLGGLVPSLRDLPVLLAAALFAVAIVSLF